MSERELDEVLPQPADRPERGRRIRLDTGIRLFLGAELSTAAIRELTATAARVRDDARSSDVPIRWVTPASYHITLRFLGWTMPEIVEVLRDRLAAPLAKIPEFEIEGRGLGAFPRADRARVLWAGIADPSNGLTQLAEIVEDVLEDLGFGREERPFHPHVTLGRIKPPADIRPLLPDESQQVFSTCTISSVTLYESTLKSGGSEYTAHSRWPLSRGSRKAQRQTEAVQPDPRADAAASNVEWSATAESPPKPNPDESSPDAGERPAGGGDES